MASIRERFKNAWDVFTAKESDDEDYMFSYPQSSSGYSYTSNPHYGYLRYGNERSIIASIYTRIGIDAAACQIEHVRMDENDCYKETIPSNFNDCLTLSANIDQTGRAFIQDAVMSLCDEGVIAIVPTDTTADPTLTNTYDILEMRVGRIVEWFPQHVRVELYNEHTGTKQQLILPKSMVAIVENPLYCVMNEPNSTLKRLARKLALLDMTDEANSSGKLDLIIQLPYSIKSTRRQEQADQRRKAIEDQLAGSKYGIAYIDATEHITQLNRAAENTLQDQVEYLTSMLYSQLGLTASVFDGTADEATIMNYWSRTIEPIMSAIADSMKRTFLTKTARTQGQSIMFFRDPFKMTPAEQMAEIADKFSRNAILSSNEIRAIVGYKPVDTDDANSLRNKNLNQSADEIAAAVPGADTDDSETDGSSDSSSSVDELIRGITNNNGGN